MASTSLSMETSEDYDEDESTYREDLELEDISDEEEEEGAESLRLLQGLLTPAESGRDDSEANTLALYTVAAEKDGEGVEVNSDEERNILVDIKAEILRKVRADMKDEIAMIHAGGQPGEEEGGGSSPTPLNADDLLDSRTKEGLLMVRKLDKILLRKVKREREVKRDRILLQRRLREEIELLESSKTNRSSGEMRTNTIKFLALQPPSRHNEGVHISDSPPGTPLFQTEYIDKEDPLSTARNGHPSSSNTDPSDTRRGSNLTDDHKQSAKAARKVRNAQEKAKQRRRDFIKRNIELASQASETIAMTEEEQRRLKLLLDDLDDLADLPTEDLVFVADVIDRVRLSINTADTKELDSNPFQISMAPGEGFQLDSHERQHMEQIDGRLRFLMPPEDYEAMTSPSVASCSYQIGPTTPSEQPSLFVRMRLEGGIDVEGLGEQALRDVKWDRDATSRLEQIDGALSDVTTSRDQEMTSSLSRDQLDNLLDGCFRSMSRSSFSQMTSDRATTSLLSMHSEERGGDSAPESERSWCPSGVAELVTNPPHLEADVLHRLLEEARAQGIRPAVDRGATEGGMEPISEGDEDDADDDATPRAFSSQSEVPPVKNQSESSTIINTNNPQLPSSRPNSSEGISASRIQRRSKMTNGSLSVTSSRSSTPLMAQSAEEEGDNRLVLPDITLYEQKTGPRLAPK